MISLKTIICMYITLTPIIITGPINMLFCKKDILAPLNIPIDNNIVLKDGNRLFGSNKTLKGFLGYVLFCAIFTVMWGSFLKLLNLENYNYFYFYHENNLFFNIFTGSLVGIAYALFELPNSFLKRRLNIKPGEKAPGPGKILFSILDQIDSLFGCVLVVAIFYKMSFLFYVFYVAIGGLTHFFINIILYVLRWRKTLF